MKKILGTVQQRIGLLICLVGIFVLVDNIINRYIDGQGRLEYIITGLSVWFLFLTILPFIISVFIESDILKIIQSIAILIMGFMSMIESYDTVYGPGLLLAAWLLMRHYGYFDNYRKIKYSLFLVFMIVTAQVSAFYNKDEVIGAGLAMLEYSVFIILFLVIIWRDMVLDQERLRVENKSLRINYTRIRDQLIELEEEQKPYNFKAVKITPAEERVIKTLTIYKASNREIAERLNIAEPTVKLHLYNIYNKIGIDNRFAIIDLCKYNYT